MPDVRRQGSLRGSGGGAEAIASNSCRAQSSLPCRSSSFSSASRRSTSSSTSRAAYRSHGSGSGRVDQSTAEWPFSSTKPSTFSTIAPRPTRGNPASPTRQLGVEEPRRRHAYLAETGQVLGGGVQHPLDAGQRLVQRGEVGAGDRVDQRRARALAAELDEVGALPVAVAGGALGVHGDGAAARGEGGDHLGEGGLVGHHGRDALAGLQQGDRRLCSRGSAVVRRGASGGAQ